MQTVRIFYYRLSFDLMQTWPNSNDIQLFQMQDSIRCQNIPRCSAAFGTVEII